MNAVQPEHLGVAVLLRPLPGADGGGVVAAALGVAGAALDGADVLVLHIDLHRVDSLGVVCAHRAGDDAEQVVVGGVHAQGGSGGDDEGTDIQGGARLGGHPAGLQAHELLNGGQGVLLRQGGDAHALTGGVDAPDVLHGAEELHPAVGAAVGLQALKDLLGIVEHHGGGLQGEGAVGHDAPVVPALAGGVVHDKHMVGKGLAEDQRVGIGLRLEHRGALHGIFLHGNASSIVHLFSKSMAVQGKKECKA